VLCVAAPATKVLTTLKLPQDMSPAEKAAAGTAAAAWRQELLQQQALLAELAERAEAAELALAEERLGGGGASRQAQAQDDNMPKGRPGELPPAASPRAQQAMYAASHCFGLLEAAS
jgi:hypothetical protein